MTSDDPLDGRSVVPPPPPMPPSPTGPPQGPPLYIGAPPAAVDAPSPGQAPPVGPPPAPASSTDAPAGPPPRRNGLLIGLAVACGVLLLTTLGFGASTLLLLNAQGSATATPSPSPSATGEAAPEWPSGTIGGLEITAISDLAFSRFAMSPAGDGIHTVVYALVTNESETEAANHFFDITAYRKDGTIVDRGSDSVYLPPGQTTVFQGIFTADMSETASFTIEQTSTEWEAPLVSGNIDITEVRGGEGLVEADLVSTLSAPAEYTDIYIVGFLDGEIFGLCNDIADVPASGGAVSARCILEAASPEDATDDVSEIPEDATFDVFLKIDSLIGE